MLGIIGAMDQEVSILKEKMEVKKIDRKASMEFYVGTLNGKDVVIVKCGVGKVGVEYHNPRILLSKLYQRFRVRFARCFHLHIFHASNSFSA